MQTYISKANYLSLIELIDESSSIVRQVSEFLVFKRQSQSTTKKALFCAFHFAALHDEQIVAEHIS